MADNVKTRGIEFEIKGNADAASKSIEKLVATLKSLRSAGKSVSELSSVNNEIKKLSENKVTKIIDPVKISKDLQSIEKQILSTTKIFDSLDDKLQDLQERRSIDISAGSKTNSGVLEEIDDLIQRTSGYGALLDSLKEKRSSLLNGAVGGAIEPKTSGVVEDATEAVKRHKTVLGELISMYGGFGGTVRSAFGSLGGLLKTTASGALHLGAAFAGTLWGGAKKAASGLADLGKKLGGRLISGLKDLASYAGKAATNLLAMPFKNIGSMASGFAGKISKVGSAFKRSLFYRAVRTLIREIGQAFKTGVNNLYQWSAALNGEFARSMDSAATSMLYLKNSAGAMVSPLVNALAPALDYVVDKVVTLMNAINQLIAKLTGASYWTRAKKQATSYGDAVSDAVGGAGSAAKEAMKYLAPFDELNVLPDTAGGGGGSGGAGGGTDYSGMFEEMVQFDSSISSFVDKLKESWEAADFTEVGTIVGTKLKDALDNIPWSGIKETCNRIAQSLATFINGFVETPGLWTTLGKTIGEGINTAVGMWNTFFDVVNFENIGSGIAEALNNAFNTINPAELGRALSQQIRAMIDAAYGFVKDFEFLEFGGWIGEAINGFFQNIDFAKLGETLGDAISGVISAGVGIAATMDFDSLGTDISTAITNALSSIQTTLERYNWKFLGRKIVSGINSLMDGLSGEVNLGTTLASLINSALDFLGGAINGAKWSKWGSTLATNINGLFNKVDWDKAGATISNGVTGALDFLLTLSDDVSWGDVAQSVSDCITSALNEFSKWLQGTDWESIGKNFVDDFSDAVKKFDWVGVISSISVALGSAARAKHYLFSGVHDELLSAIFEEKGKKSAGDNIFLKIWDNIIDPLMAAYKGPEQWAEMKKVSSDFINSLVSGDEFSNMELWVKTHIVDKITGAFSKAGKWFSSIGVTIWNSIVDGIANTAAGAKIEEWFSWTGFNWKDLHIDVVADVQDIQIGGKSLDGDGFGGGAGGTFGDVPVKGIISSFVDSIKIGDRTLERMSANITTANDKIANKKKVTTGWTAQHELLSAKWDDGQDWTTAGWTAKHNYISPLWKTGQNWTTTGWTAQHNYLSPSWKSGQNWTTTGWTAQHNYLSPVWKSGQNWTTTGWTAQHNYISPSWRSGQNWSTTGWTAQHNYLSAFWKSGQNWTTTGWYAQHNYQTQNWKSGQNWTTTGWYAQHNYQSRDWKSNISWTTTGWTARMDYVRDNIPAKDKTINVLANVRYNASGGVFSGGTWHNIAQYASGGLPRGSQLFWAREAGPELVGTLGGHTAVMNNDQIVASVSAGVARAIAGIRFKLQGMGDPMATAVRAMSASTDAIESGVYRAVTDANRSRDAEYTEDTLYRAFRRALSEIDFGGDETIELDGAVLYRKMVERNNRNTKMTGVNALA